VGPSTAARLNSGSASRYTLSSGGGGSSSTDTSAPPTGNANYDVDDADPKNVLNQSNLNPTVKALAVRTIESMQAQGYAPYLFEGHRTMERQNSLYAQGRTAPGSVVTYVRGGGSWHNYGLAVDIVFWDRSHSGPSWGAPSSHWAALGRAGKAAGFTRWMGDTGWDQAHFEHHPRWGNGCTNLLSTYNSGGFQAVWDTVI
jgi:peptidoglycan LD-endopeptidase CwlK